MCSQLSGRATSARIAGLIVHPNHARASGTHPGQKKIVAPWRQLIDIPIHLWLGAFIDDRAIG
jgi:hypothetical protein